MTNNTTDKKAVIAIWPTRNTLGGRAAADNSPAVLSPYAGRFCAERPSGRKCCATARAISLFGPFVFKDNQISGRNTTPYKERPILRAVITGGAGFLGSHLCDYFIEKGWEVLCLDNLVTGSESNIAHLLSNPRFRFTPARCNSLHRRARTGRRGAALRVPREPAGLSEDPHPDDEGWFAGNT